MLNTSLPLTRVQSHAGLHHRPPVAMEFSPDGTLLVSASRDSSVFVFGTDTATALAAVELDVHVAPTCVAWHDPSSFWLASSDGSVVLWALSRSASSPMSLRIADALPYHFPAPPSLVCVRNQPKEPAYVVVGFASTFEVWQRPRGARRLRAGGGREWQPLGKASSTGHGGVALMAWPLSKESVLVLFQTAGARVWKCDDDRLLAIVGWPAGTPVRSSAFLPSPYAPARDIVERDEIVHIVGHVVLVDATAASIQILSLALEPIPYVTPLRTVHLSSTATPSIGVITSWSGLTTLIMADKGDIGAYDLSATAFQQAALKAAANGVPAPVASNDIRTLNLSPTGLGASRVTSFSGRFVRLVATAHRAASGGSGYTVSVWSTAEGVAGTESGIARPHRVPRVRMHVELERYIARYLSARSATLRRMRVFLAAAVLLIAAIAAHRLGLQPVPAGQPIDAASRLISRLQRDLIGGEEIDDGRIVELQRDGQSEDKTSFTTVDCDLDPTGEGCIIYLP